MKTLTVFFAIIFVSIPEIFAQNDFEMNFGTTGFDNGLSVQQTFDGKYIVAGTTDTSGIGIGDLYCGLIDADGTLLWTKTIGGNLDDGGYSVVQMADSAFAILGSTNSFGNGNADVYLVKIDANGDTLWTKTFGGSDYDYGYVVQNTFDGGLILGGQESTTGAGIAYIYLIKTNSDGDTTWTKSYPVGAWAGTQSIVQTPDSGFLVFGDFENNVTSNGDYDLVCIKTDVNGDTLWTRTYLDSSFHDYAQAVRETFDGGFLLASQGESISAFNSLSKIIRIDVNGDTLWTKLLGLNYNCAVTDIIQTADSGFVITGYSLDTLLSANSLFITKINSIGDSLWSKFHDGLFSATGNSIYGTSDNGFVICGMTFDSIIGLPNVYVLKTNSNGDILLCQPVIISQPLDTTAIQGNNTSFSVIASPTAAYYQWQQDSLGIFVNIIDDTFFAGSNTNTLLLTGVNLNNAGLQVRCIVVDSSNCSDTSSVVTLNVITLPGISEYEVSKNGVYPNPAGKSLFISGAKPESIILYDIFGNEINKYSNVQNIDVSFLPSGVYYIALFNKNKNEAQVCRFIKN